MLFIFVLSCMYVCWSHGPMVVLVGLSQPKSCRVQVMLSQYESCESTSCFHVSLYKEPYVPWEWVVVDVELRIEFLWNET